MEHTEDPDQIRLCVFGRPGIQTRLLADTLSTALNTTYVIHHEIETCFSVASLNQVPTVLLLDADYVPAREILSYLHHSAGIPPHINLAFFNMPHGQGLEQDAVRSGVRGFFYEEETLETMKKGVTLLAKGEPWVSRRILLDAALQHIPESSENHDGLKELTHREVEILAMICVGARNDDIAGKLFISTNTVKTHIYNIYKKIHVPNRTQAALWAAKHL